MVLIDDRHRQALILLNVAIDYLKSAYALEGFYTYAVNNLTQRGYDSYLVSSLVKNVTEDIKEHVHNQSRRDS